MIVLDTDVLIEIFDKRSKRGDKALEIVVKSGEAIAITVINLHEIIYGLHKYAKPVNEVLQLPVLEYGKDDAILAANIEVELERSGVTVRRTDAIIASITINNRAKLYTFDVEHFKPIERLGLKLFK
jgi:predicted nucleic acid-binding protein